MQTYAIASHGCFSCEANWFPLLFLTRLAGCCPQSRAQKLPARPPPPPRHEPPCGVRRRAFDILGFPFLGGFRLFGASFFLGLERILCAGWLSWRDDLALAST